MLRECLPLHIVFRFDASIFDFPTCLIFPSCVWGWIFFWILQRTIFLKLHAFAIEKEAVTHQHLTSMSGWKEDHLRYSILMWIFHVDLAGLLMESLHFIRFEFIYKNNNDIATPELVLRITSFWMFDTIRLFRKTFRILNIVDKLKKNGLTAKYLVRSVPAQRTF